MRIPATICLLLLSVFAFSQPKQRKLNPALNSPSFNYWAPYISLDGSTILFTSDYTDDSKPALFIALRQGVDWKEPVLIPKKMTALGFTKAFTLSVDGKTMYITSSRGGTLGGFDILVSQISGTTFSDPQSIGAPINSSTNEASPSISPDGTTLYFMRCNKMDFNGADECKIMMAKKKYGLWEKPVELPASINAGNSQMPRMLGDGLTLVFSSNKHKPSKGGMDFYVSRLTDGEWGPPINLEFVNTAKDDLYASASSVGLSLLKDALGERKNELVEFAFPPEVKPKAVVRIVGIVEGLTDLIKANVSLVNLETKKTLFNLNPDAKGNFVCYIPEGGLYSLYVDAPTDNFRFFSKRYDLTPGKKFGNIDRITATLKPLAPGDEIELTGVSFKPFTHEIEPTSIVDLQKISRLMRGNPAQKFNVDVSLFGFEKDSIRREGLTEMVADTVVYTMEVQIDSVTTETVDSLAVEYSYHNDRTPKQAQAISDFMEKQGVKPDRISLTYKALEEPVAEKRKIVIYLKSR
jgi:WD40-like Beta Propeller Repeat